MRLDNIELYERFVKGISVAFTIYPILPIGNDSSYSCADSKKIPKLQEVCVQKLVNPIIESDNTSVFKDYYQYYFLGSNRKTCRIFYTYDKDMVEYICDTIEFRFISIQIDMTIKVREPIYNKVEIFTSVKDFREWLTVYMNASLDDKQEPTIGRHFNHIYKLPEITVIRPEFNNKPEVYSFWIERRKISSDVYSHKVEPTW